MCKAGAVTVKLQWLSTKQITKEKLFPSTLSPPPASQLAALLGGIEELQQDLELCALLAEVSDDSAGGGHNLPCLALLVNLAQAAPEVVGEGLEGGQA